MNYTEEEVAEHRSEESCWIIINKKVLDVTQWLKRHPGGKTVLLELGGRDASFDFASIGHSRGAWKEMSKYEIGAESCGRRSRASGGLPRAAALATAVAATVLVGMAAARAAPVPRAGTLLPQAPRGMAGVCFNSPPCWGVRVPAPYGTPRLRPFSSPSMMQSRGGPRESVEDEDEEITTYVSCPNCMSDSFIKPEVLGEGMRLRCANCGRSFNATQSDLCDIGDVYQASSASPAAGSSGGGGGGFTEDSFFEMFGDKKSFQPPP